MKTIFKMPRKRLICFIFVLLLIILKINSSAWFRAKLADYQKSKEQYVKAAELYNQILTKNSIKNHLSKKKLANINFSLGDVCAKSDLRNLAIESYARGCSELRDNELDAYRNAKQLEEKKLFAVGLLEAGRLNEATNEFKRLKQLDDRFVDTEKYVNVATSLENQAARYPEKAFYFLLGDAYIKSELFTEARAFFAKRILDYGIAPLEVMEYLHSSYYDKTKIVEKVWGDNIYVTLEDFETLEPKLYQWYTHIESEIIEHAICMESAYRGKRSKVFNIKYFEKGSDWWVQVVNIPLDFKNFKLGIRLFIFTEEQSSYYLYVNINFPEAGVDGTYTVYDNRLVLNGWHEYSIKDIANGATSIAQPRGWDQGGAVINKIIIDTRGQNGKFYIDEIDLFLEKAV